MITDSNDLTSMMADDADKPADVGTTKLKELTSLALDMKKREVALEKAEAALKKAKEELAEIQMIKIPDLFDELQLSEIKLEDGTKVTVVRSYAANISAENKETCFAWLRSNGHESIIKHNVTAKLKKGELKEHTKLIALLNQLQLSYDDKESVHPMTLKAFIKEQIEEGTDIPQEAFGVYPIRKTKLK